MSLNGFNLGGFSKDKIPVGGSTYSQQDLEMLIKCGDKGKLAELLNLYNINYNNGNKENAQLILNTIFSTLMYDSENTPIIDYEVDTSPRKVIEGYFKSVLTGGAKFVSLEVLKEYQSEKCLYIKTKVLTTIGYFYSNCTYRDNGFSIDGDDSFANIKLTGCVKSVSLFIRKTASCYEIASFSMKKTDKDFLPIFVAVETSPNDFCISEFKNNIYNHKIGEPIVPVLKSLYKYDTSQNALNKYKSTKK